MTSPLHHRWYVPVGAFAVLAVGITGVAAAHLRGFHRDLTAHVEGELLTIAHLKATEIVEWRDHMVLDAADLQHTVLAGSLADAVAPHADANQVRVALYRLAIHTRRYGLDEGSIVNAHGEILLSTRDRRHALDGEERSALAAALRDGTPTLVDLASDGGAVRLIVPLPVARTPRLAAVFSGRIHGSFPESVRAWPSPARSAEAYLAAVHGDQVVVLDALRFVGGAPYPPRFAIRDASYPLARAARGEEGVGPALDHRGARVLAARLRIPRTSWVLSVKENEQELLAPALERERSLTIAVAALLVACGAALVFWWRSVRADLARRERDLQEQERRRSLHARLAFSDRLASLGTLAAGIAHEINNPLSYVVSNLEFAHDSVAHRGAEADREALVAALAESRHGARRIADIVSTLRTFSRRDRGDRAQAPVDLRDAVRAATLMASHQIRGRAQLDVDLCEVPPVAAPESELAQIVVNLLLNAVQALPPAGAGRRDQRIRVATRADRDGALLEVADTGTGMAPETVAHIFDPFFTTKPPGEGTGLGLWVCHGIVERLGGRIEVESNVGVGSTFRVVIPPASPRQAA